MNGAEYTDRRTVLKAITATAIGGSVVTGATNAVSAGPHGQARGRRDIVEIVARHDHEAEGTGEHRFELSTSETAAGWTTLEFDNRTEHTHFAYLQKIPQPAIDAAESKDRDLLDYWVEKVTDPFQVFMDWILGKVESPAAFPTWFGQIEPSGGVGLTTGHTTARTTVNLDPGQYQVECYVKNDSNEFHSYLGMVDLLTVTEERSGVEEPEATLDLSLSTTDGITADDEVRPGQHTVAVQFKDQEKYGHLLGHDVHLVRLDDGTNVDDVNNWMDWTNRFGTTGNQLVADGSEPGTFLGGVQDIWPFLEGGSDLPETGYCHVNLKPGDYAWVAEVPDPRSKGMLQEFTVPFGRKTGGR
ncbi:MAG: hypothetical protein V5A55_07615 [Halovenus sp.]